MWNCITKDKKLLFFSLFIFQCRVDKLVFIDVAESSTKGGSTDLEIFSLPNVEVSRGTSDSALSPGSADVPLAWVTAALLLSESVSDDSLQRRWRMASCWAEIMWIWAAAACCLCTLCCFDFSELSASAGSKVVVVTANAWSGEQSYVSVVQTNVDLYRGIVPGLARLSPSAVMIVASQPGGVDWAAEWRHHSWHLFIPGMSTTLFHDINRKERRNRKVRKCLAEQNCTLLKKKERKIKSVKT